MQTTGNGKVFVAQPLDWEEQPFYSLNISISDGVNTIYTQVRVTFAALAVNFAFNVSILFVPSDSSTSPCWM